MGPFNADLLRRLRSLVPDRLMGEPDVWIVGGAVRDALLGRAPRELDFVVEGDAVAVARRLGGPILVHERFGTAATPDVDLASARTETYAQPGALPDATLGATVQEDLARRDFSVNAMAVRLRDGAAAVWPGALEDLEAGVLRVLHPRSFLDDPTRLLRLARYAARLGFPPDPETDRLAAAAVGAGAPATVSGSRLGAELRLLLDEPQPAALEALARHGLGAAVIHPAFAVDPELVAAVVAEAAARGPAAAREAAAPGLAALAATLLDAPREEVATALDRLAFPAAGRDAVVAAAGGRGLAARLAAASAPSDIAEVARRQPPEALALAAALGAREPVRAWLDEHRHVRLAIDGDDLVAAGLRGPAVGAGLRAALAAALDGRAPDRQSQLEIALQGIQFKP